MADKPQEASGCLTVARIREPSRAGWLPAFADNSKVRRRGEIDSEGIAMTTGPGRCCTSRSTISAGEASAAFQAMYLQSQMSPPELAPTASTKRFKVPGGRLG